MTSIFANIAIFLSLAAVLSAIFAKARQPLLLSYLLVGIIAASSGLFREVNSQTLDFFAELGIAFALFLIGLELRFSDIRQISRTAILIGLGQVIFTAFFGFLLSRQLGFSNNEALYLGIALALSSTLIVIKLLLEKRALDSLYGKITTGYLIVQDFVAIAALIVLTSFSKGGASDFLLTLVKGAFLVFLILILNKYVLKKLFGILAKNSEVLFLTSVAWALVFAAVFVSFGFSIEIGAFLAGLGLASLREEVQIASWIRPLRNLFIVLFFLNLGLHLPISNFFSQFGVVFLLSAFVLIGNPLIMMIIMGTLGFRTRTSFNVSVTSAQLSEFSLILVFLGARLGFIGNSVVNVTVATALVTIIFSTYLIKYSSKIYKFVSPYLKIFERKNLTEAIIKNELVIEDHVVLIGAGRLGWNILCGLKANNQPLVVVDFNPDVIKKLEKAELIAIYGEATDPEILDKAKINRAKMIISTIFEYEENRELLFQLKNLNKKIPIIVTSPDTRQALELYRLGASYVIIPRILSSQLIEKFLTGTKLEALENGSLRKAHIEEITNFGNAVP